jgi:eukaryotic-like serine/threonine-protein kinase
MNELAGQNLGGYQLDEEIGRGSMGIVYRGKQIALGREVAIKVLSRALASDVSYVARFIREAQIIAGLNHPNIVQIFDAGQQRNLLYFVMEYVQGPTLASLLHLDGIIPQYLAAEYGAQIADALDAAYEELHVIHRDIKPENLMLDRWGKIKVMDFGLARALGHQKITVAKTLVGSLYYASPEQVWGQTLDNRSDIYALGVVLYEMVSGHRPFMGRTLPELTQAIISSPLQPPGRYNPELSPELEQIILQAMARDRDQRFAQASLVAQALRALDLQAPALSGPPVAPRSPAQSGRERVFIQPPKRPRAATPLSLDAGTSQSANVIADLPTNPRLETSPSQETAPSPASPAYVHPVVGIDTEGPTGPLIQPESPERSHPLNTVHIHVARGKRRKQQRRTLWEKFFKH